MKLKQETKLQEKQVTKQIAKQVTSIKHYKHHVLSHSSSNWHNAVHSKLVYTHLHLEVHPFLQEHLTSPVQDLANSGDVIHKGIHLSSALLQLQRLTSCATISPTIHHDQQ